MTLAATFRDVAECTNVADCGFEGSDSIAGALTVIAYELLFIWDCPSCGEQNETPLGDATAADRDYQRDLELAVA